MIILVSGKQRSGKDFCCNLIQELTGGQLKRVGLADALKDEYSKATGMPRPLIEELKNIAQVREQLILLGQARKINNQNMNYWLGQLPEDNILIADARYKEEVDYFKPKNGIAIRLECPREVRAQRGTLSNENHPSETELDDYKEWDYMIDSAQSMDTVANEVKGILKQLNII